MLDCCSCATTSELAHRCSLPQFLSRTMSSGRRGGNNGIIPLLRLAPTFLAPLVLALRLQVLPLSLGTVDSA
eukprot:10324957-Prorocentrum_lima.AAC.1